MRRGRGIASVLLTVSAASGAAAAWTAGVFASAPSVVGSPRLQAAVLSPRRAPDAFVGLVADTRLAGRLARFAETVPGDECLAVSADSRPVFRHKDAEPLIPASTMKLLTARAVATRKAGPSSWSTSIYGPPPSQSGTVEGDLLLQGGGDPLLSTPEYAASLRRPLKTFTDVNELARKLAAAGVRRVTGSVVASDVQFDHERAVPTWKPDHLRVGDVGLIGALVVNDGFTAFGARFVPAADPAIAAGELLVAALARVGVTVEGGVRHGDQPAPTNPKAPLASVAVAVRTVLTELLTESDNTTAEILVKQLVASPRHAAPATRSAGLAEAREVLDELKLPTESLVTVDGSGLDRGNRATCRLLLAALDPPTTELDLVPLLALADRTGTLTDRFQGHPLAGKMRAKTGALAGVVGLVGVADETSPIPLRFAFLANGSFSEPGGRQLQERLGTVLATYPDAPPAASIAP